MRFQFVSKSTSLDDLKRLIRTLAEKMQLQLTFALLNFQAIAASGLNT